MMHFTASVLDSGVQEGLRKITEKLDYPLPLWRRIGLIYKENIESRFKNFNDPQGKNWKHNTKTTQLLKKIGWEGRDPAIDGPYNMGTWTGELKDSIAFNIRGNDISVGVLSNSPASRYASTFQFGANKNDFKGKAPWNNIPPRQFLGFNKTTNAKVIKLIKDHFADATN